MSKRPKLKELLKATLLSKSDQKGVLLLIPILIIIAVLFAAFNRNDIEASLTDYSDLAYRNKLESNPATPNIRHQYTQGRDNQGRDNRNNNNHSTESRSYPARPEAELFEFDPNTIDQDGLERLGFSLRQAEAILRYRNSGARFGKAEDFARCYTVSPEKFNELKPYIRIDEEFKAVAHASPTDTTTRPPHAVLPNISASTTVSTTSHIKPGATSPIELNSADSATLVSIRGIGATTASRIIAYRKLLGGFASADQLSEIVGITEKNYLMILQQIWVDSGRIKKIDINFATPKQITEHPYLPARTVNKLFKNRQLKGGWSTIEELVTDKILTEVQAAKLSPYIYFSER